MLGKVVWAGDFV